FYYSGAQFKTLYYFLVIDSFKLEVIFFFSFKYAVLVINFDRFEDYLVQGNLILPYQHQRAIA
ncbi:hypothetical protein, partial [Yersinia enterocolitica]|uniref:hypothetical protein n=1 Tax=Yersinia enterocolitica TaxID=630 RepID=UPI00313B3709